MKTISITKARSNLYQLIDETAKVHEPIQITGKRTNAILLSEDDWRAIQETPLLTLNFGNARINTRRSGIAN